MNKQIERKPGSHIKLAERLEIYILLNRGYSLHEIARALKRSVSSISSEISENKVNDVYDPYKADHKAYCRRKYSKYQGMKVVTNKELKNYIIEHLAEGWSPEVISGRLKEIDTQIKYAGKGAIYKFIYSIYGRSIEKYLHKNRVKKKSGPKRGSQRMLQERVFIDDRPKEANDRAVCGHYEGDFIVSGRDGSGALLVVQERKSRYVFIRKLASRDITNVHKSFEAINKKIKGMDSLTLDNDISFRRHKELSQILSSAVYFCHPYHSWEKGGVENMNKLIREDIPKRTDISKVEENFIQSIQEKNNHRPRKCLKFKTPYEIMVENKQLRNLDDNFIPLKTKNHLVGGECKKLRCSV